nr:hypothetical protein [uncultured Undibacterium sp.]
MEQLQQIIQLYRKETGNRTVDMDDVAEFAMQKGVAAPKPKSPKELLSAQLSQAAREEHKTDPVTGWSYRVNHALRFPKGDGSQLTLWVDIEEATRPQMHLSLTNRRQQMIGDGVQLKIDEIIWNSRNPNEIPLQMIMDFTDDVEERLNSPDMDSKAA